MGQQILNFLNKNMELIPVQNYVNCLKSLKESAQTRSLLDQLDWAKIENYLYGTFNKNMKALNVVVLSNMTYFEEYCGGHFNKFLLRRMIYRIEQQMQM